MLNRRNSPSRKVCLLCLGTFLVVGIFCRLSVAEDDKQLKKKLQKAENQLRLLQDGEGAPPEYEEYEKLQKKILDMKKSHYQKLREPRKKMHKLRRKDGVKKWLRKIREKRGELNRLRRKMRSEIQKRARKLYQRRHKELESIAVAITPRARKLGFTALTYPQVDGSTSTRPLGLVIACKVLDCPYGWKGKGVYSGEWHTDDPLRSIRGTFSSPVEAAGPPLSEIRHRGHARMSLVSYRPVAQPADPDKRADVRRSIIINRMLNVHAGTHGAYVNVIEGNSDLGLVARRPSKDELKLAKKKGVEIVVKPVAYDAFVFIKNYQNKVENLSTEQIQRIYSGRITNWEKVGGVDQQIHAYRRNRNSGSHELMKTLVMKDVDFNELESSGLGERPRLIHHGMGGPYIALTHNENGLAYSVYYYEHFMAGSPNTELMAVDGVKPSYSAIQSGKYPYVTKVYAIVRDTGQTNPGAIQLRDWLLSPEGQKVVRESGYVPLKAQKEE